ncbi:MAG: PQQ-binding-like beta-propeller repeat protein, partial [Planctomycetota bacterium]
TARKGLENLLGEIPAPYRQEGRQILRLERAALGDYFLSVANADASYVVEARTLVAKRIRELLARAPGGVRQQYEKRAAADLQRDRSVGVGERLLWCWPESEAAKTTVRELAAKTAGMKPVEQQAMRWRLADLAGACGLDETLVPHGMRGLSRAPAPSGLAAGARMKQVEVKNPDPDTVRLALPQTGDVERTRHLLFVGGRKRRAYGNRFTVLCWNMKTNEQEWLSREILLHGKADGGGYEVGFEQVLIHEGLALVHGRHDVVALDCRPGRDLDATGKKEKRWHFRVSPGFEIHAAKLCGDVLVLCGRGSTVAISPRTGEILWDASEAGEFYAGPFFHEDVMLTLRRSPAEVSFRKVGSGRLVCRLGLPGLTTNRKHPMFSLEGTGDNPAAAEAVEAYPVAFAEGHVAVSDGNTYHVVDVARRRVRWSRPASKLDPSQDPAYRMWIDGGRLFVLKPYYAVLENVVFDLASGDMLWRRREGGKKQDARIKKFEKERGEEPGDRAATGLVLSSMTFLDGKVYGIKYQMGTTSVELVGMDPASGEQVMKVKESGYDAPEACVEPSWSEECVVVRIQDGNRFELWQVDVKAGKIVQRLALKGYGRLGEYGDVSMVWQGPYQAIWAFDSRKFTVPAK